MLPTKKKEERNEDIPDDEIEASCDLEASLGETKSAFTGLPELVIKKQVVLQDKTEQ